MTSTSPGPDESPPPFPPEAKVISEREVRRPFQFSLKSLLVATALIAVVCGLWAVLPSAFSQILAGAVWIAASSWVAVGLLFARGERQAFYLGAAIVITSMWTGLGGRFMDGVHQIFRPLFFGAEMYKLAWIDLLVLAATAIANGYLCIYAKRFFDRTTQPRDRR